MEVFRLFKAKLPYDPVCLSVVGWLVGWLVGRLVGWSVFHIKGGKFHYNAPIIALVYTLHCMSSPSLVGQNMQI